MLRERELKTAEHFGITEQLKKLNEELLSLDGVSDVDYYLDGFWDGIPHVIFLPERDIPIGENDYFRRRRQLLTKILEIASQNGLSRTEDAIEDYGSCWYIVTRCNWLRMQ